LGGTFPLREYKTVLGAVQARTFFISLLLKRHKWVVGKMCCEVKIKNIYQPDWAVLRCGPWECHWPDCWAVQKQLC